MHTSALSRRLPSSSAHPCPACGTVQLCRRGNRGYPDICRGTRHNQKAEGAAVEAMIAVFGLDGRRWGPRHKPLPTRKGESLGRKGWEQRTHLALDLGCFQKPSNLVGRAQSATLRRGHADQSAGHCEAQRRYSSSGGSPKKPTWRWLERAGAPGAGSSARRALLCPPAGIGPWSIARSHSD